LAVAAAAVLSAYVILLPLVHGALFYTLYARRPLPRRFQHALERYTNVFGIIIWRVFSSDLVNFYIRILGEDRRTGARVLLSRYGIRGGPRFGHVAESIAVTSVFSTLKYYATQRELFERRLLRYARTLAGPHDVLVFEYVSLRKTPARFEPVVVAEYEVDPRSGAITHRALSSEVSVHAPHRGSLLFEGATPGSYAPLQAEASRHR
jgi:hypothetical protein